MSHSKTSRQKAQQGAAAARDTADHEVARRRAERRAARELRRAKQRIANVGRAKAMHEARVTPSASSGDMQDRAEPNTLNIGCSGWFYWHWRSCFYPDELSTTEWFDHYAARLRTVELNAPFYAWPTVATVRNWVKQAKRKHFVYTVKVSELITHVKRFEGTKTLVRDFGYIADILGSRMGCFLFQLPPSYRFTPARLRAIVSQLEPHRRNVVEFRHASWWNDDVYAAFTKAGIIFCSCSGPRLPDMLVRTADDIYLRFHGTTRWYRHNYSRAELQVWADRVTESGAKRVWAYFNNDRDCYAIANAKTLKRLLTKAPASARTAT
jgi:uncharacterized protein YecE (DUF72 family)